jgi:hypothetical protein
LHRAHASIVPVRFVAIVRFQKSSVMVSIG